MELGVTISIISGVIALGVAYMKCHQSNKELEEHKKQFEFTLQSQQSRFYKEFEESKKQFEATLQSQQSELYKELITSENIKSFNSLRDAMIDVLNLSLKLTFNALFIGENQVEEHSFVEEYKKILADFHAKIMRIKLTIKPNESDFLQKVEDYKQAVSKFIEKIIKARKGDIIDEGLRSINRSFEEKCQCFLKKEWERIEAEASALYSNGKEN